MHYLCPLLPSIKSYTLPEEKSKNWTFALCYPSPGPPGCDTNNTIFSFFMVMLHLRASLGPALHLQEFLSLAGSWLLGPLLLCNSHFLPEPWFSLMCVCTSTSTAMWHLVMVPWHAGSVSIERGEPCLALSFIRAIFFPLVNGETTEKPPEGE